MMAKIPRSWLAIGAAALAQTAALSWIVYDRITLLRDGREIVVEVIPVDPRDLFRGDYVILGYGFSLTGEVEVAPTVRQGDSIYATLSPKGGDVWEVAAVGTSYPAAVAPESVVLKGIASNVWSRGPDTKPAANVRYGIESYFVPEGTGKELENLVRDKKISAVIAVGSKGDAAIKALVVDGKRVAEEPLL
jgi:uncharacterized membrane-anchored protein